MDAGEHAVARANARFYEAFSTQDSEAMTALWAKEHMVTCVHPGSGLLRGRAAVLASWASLFRHPRAPKVEAKDVAVTLVEGTALVTCLEGAAGQRPNLSVTNVFVLESDGAWRVVHRHVGAILQRTSKRPSAPPRTLN